MNAPSAAATPGGPPRHPAGYRGGQFAPGQHAEVPEVTLDLDPDVTDDEYNAEGTFSYPPFPRSVAQHVAFWSHVPIPDIVLEQVTATYSLNAMPYRERYPYDQELANSNGVYREDWARREALHTRKWEGRPRELYAPQVRPLVRAAQMLWYANALSVEDEQRVSTVRLTIPGTGGVTMTAAEAVAAYDLQDIRNAMADPSLYDNQRLSEITAEVRKLRDDLASSRR